MLGGPEKVGAVDNYSLPTPRLPCSGDVSPLTGWVSALLNLHRPCPRGKAISYRARSGAHSLFFAAKDLGGESQGGQASGGLAMQNSVDGAGVRAPADSRHRPSG